MEISLENLYVDIGAERVKRLIESCITLRNHSKMGMYFVTIVNKSKAINILLHANYIQKSIYEVLDSDFLSHSEC